MKSREQVIEEISSAIWLAEARRGGGPVAKLRTLEEWKEQSEETHDRYRPLAEAAWKVMVGALITGIEGFLPYE